MEEKILNTRKNGMAMLLLTLLGYVVAIALFISVTYTLEPNISIALIMGRYFPIVGQVAIAGLLASKKCIPESAGTLRTDTGTFSLMTFAVIIIVAALSFFPALALGPIADYLTF